MIEEQGIIDQPNPTLMKQRSLLNKYQIPIGHLNFEYIGLCKDVKELERIVRILRSGEEGFYPELQQVAEERLRSLSPNNRHIRSEEPALRRSSMNKAEWNNITSEISSWKKEISVRDLRLTEENNNIMDEITLPPIRQPPPSKFVPEKNNSIDNKIRAKRSSDYASWDKYDADTELLKMDLEQEREKEKQDKAKRQKDEEEKKRLQNEIDRLQNLLRNVGKYSLVERQVFAEDEKNRGNEYYKAKEYSDAIRYYSASIAVWPTAKAYNNRAACHLKQCKYSAALDDANNTLKLEPNNAKALYRRGIALQHRNQFREALADMNAVLKLQPKHYVAQQICKELREQILTLPKNVRIMSDQGLSKSKKVVEMGVKELTRDSLAGNAYEVNEWGLPKVMCQCSGSPSFLRLAPRPRLPVHAPPSCAKIVELTDEPHPTATTTTNPTKLEIVEVQKLDNTEDFCKPAKFVVIDKRTQRGLVPSGEISVFNGENTNLVKGISTTNSASADSGMDEDFELNCPLLEDPLETLVEPSV